MSRLLYVDCVAGVAGDMLLAALIDAGAGVDDVRAGLGGLAVDGLRLELSRSERHGIAAARVEVIAPAGHAPRRLPELRQLIDSAGLPERARARAQETFRRLAEAEGAVHDVAPEAVHFHELGALDALADVCGVALALEELGVERLVCSPLPASRGFVDAAHGRLPLPAPATLELLKGAPMHGVDLSAELVTPTGAALVAALAEGFGPLPSMRLEAVGYGAGSRQLEERPNLVRVLVGQALGERPHAVVSLIETNLDDMAPELVPDASDAAFAAGALDVWTTPAQMKKGRPGLVLSALARPEAERPVADAILRSTTALGLRIAQLERVELERDFQTVRVAGEPVRVKVGRLGGELLNLAPEHDDCMRVAAGSGRSVKSVWAAALAAAEREVVP